MSKESDDIEKDIERLQQVNKIFREKAKKVLPPKEAAPPKKDNEKPAEKTPHKKKSIWEKIKGFGIPR